MKRYSFLLVGLVFSIAIPARNAPPDAEPPIVTVTAGSSASETGDAGVFVLTRSPYVPGVVSFLRVYYQLGGSAKAGVDYEGATTGWVTFASDESTARVLVVPLDDPLIEGTETVTLHLLPPRTHGPMKGYRIGQERSATITILDNDSASQIVIGPSAVGTVLHWPEAGMPDVVFGESELQSAYFGTTPLYRQFRRAFLEFEIPAVAGASIESATFFITDGSATISMPVPPDVHELSAYPADLIVTTNDYDQETTFITTFETDANIHGEMLALDVTEALRMSAGQNLGLRIKLAIDPNYSGTESFGAGFQSIFNGSPPRLMIRL